MAIIELFIPAPAESSAMNVGSKEMAEAWLRNVEKSTRFHSKIRGPCRMIASFVLPEEWLERHRALASDLVGLFSPVYAALRKNLLSAMKLGDSWIDRIVINKVSDANEFEMGVRIQIDWDESADRGVALSST